MPKYVTAPADGSRGSRPDPDEVETPDEARTGPATGLRATRAAENEGAPASLKTGAAGLPGTFSGRWPKRAGRTQALRAVPEPEKTWTLPAPSPAVGPATGAATATDRGPEPAPSMGPSLGSGGAAASPVGTSAAAAPVPPWLAAKTGQPQQALSNVPPPAQAARPKLRHSFLFLAFLLLVLAPIGVSAWYLYTRAADQYASTLAFSVRKEEAPSASELIGGIAGLSGASSSDTDVLAEFIQSQDMVARIDARVDLREIYTKVEGDPVFTLMDDATIEDLVTYWNRVVTLYYDGAQGLIELRVLAFDPDDAQRIATLIYDESSTMINALTAIARDDATRFARAELEIALERLKEARTELTGFRSRTQIVDPNADIQGQMGLLNTLQVQLAEGLIELDLLRETTRETDPRIRQTEQRITVIEKRIDEERAKFGIGGGGASEQAFADLVGEYESLIVDREFAEQAYVTALTNFDAAQAEAQRQSRYLAAHIQPTLAESAEYPRREMILLAITFFTLAAWATLSLIYYSIKDRR